MTRTGASLLSLLLLACPAGCDSEPSDLTDTTVPESWVVPRWSDSFRFVWADVRDDEDETMPHPYDLHLQCLRLERLVAGYPDSR